MFYSHKLVKNKGHDIFTCLSVTNFIEIEPREMHKNVEYIKCCASADSKSIMFVDSHTHTHTGKFYNFDVNTFFCAIKTLEKFAIFP